MIGIQINIRISTRKSMNNFFYFLNAQRVNNIKYELQRILQGKSYVSYGKPIQAIASYLRKSQETSALASGSKQNKAEETEELIKYINQHHLWNCDVDFNNFLSAGA